MYEGDAPLAERRAQALSLDSALLAELLGQADLRELLDPAVLAEIERELQRLLPSRACRDEEAVADLLRGIGPLSAAEVAGRRQTRPPRPAGSIAAGPAPRVQIRVAGRGPLGGHRGRRAAARRARRAAAPGSAGRVHRAGGRPAG